MSVASPSYVPSTKLQDRNSQVAFPNNVTARVATPSESTQAPRSLVRLAALEQAPSVPVQPAPTPANKILESGDVISITVLGHPELSLAEVTVSDTGKVPHPLGGSVYIAGKTLPAAAQALTKAIGVYLKRPVVTVGLVRSRVRIEQVFVVGTVKSPGVIQINPGWRVSEVIGAAGGITEPLDRVSLTLGRAKQAPKSLDLQAILNNPNSPENIVLRPNDILRFDEQSISVTVVGQVNKPGTFDLKVGTHIVDALLASGGALPDAALSQATLKRQNGTSIPLNLLAIDTGENDQSNLVLQKGDLISVPKLQSRITVLGSVTKPGTVNIPDGKVLTIADVLAESGGLAIPPQDARISIARRLPDGTLAPLKVNLQALLVNTDLEQNIPLRDGDLVTVSAIEKWTVFVTGEVKNPGPIETSANEGIVQLLVRAGGPAKDASLRSVTVTRRDSSVVKVNLINAINGGPAPDVALGDGDYINVPRNDTRILVMPAVRNPGTYSIPEDRPLTIADALDLAGGPANANLKEVAILRQTPSGVEKRIIPLTGKPEDMLSTNAILQNGDVLYVPEKEVKKGALQTLLATVPIFGLLLR